VAKVEEAPGGGEGGRRTADGVAEMEARARGGGEGGGDGGAGAGTGRRRGCERGVEGRLLLQCWGEEREIAGMGA
jgi:hypothetical protein